MAIDTIQEKASVLNLGVPWYTVGPMLSGVFGEAEFWHLLHLYASGAGAASEGGTVKTMTGFSVNPCAILRI